jgi:hypothetical protein
MDFMHDDPVHMVLWWESGKELITMVSLDPVELKNCQGLFFLELHTTCELPCEFLWSEKGESLSTLATLTAIIY